MKHAKVTLPLLAVFLVCLYPVAFSYLQNAGESYEMDMLPMLGLLLLTAAVVLGVSALILRRLPAAGLFTGLVMLLVANGGLMARFLKDHISWFHDRYLLIAMVAVAVALLILLKKHPSFPAQECCGILAILFAALTLIQLVPAAPTLWKLLTLRKAPVDIDAETVDFGDQRPNVYYFIVDEYGGTENLERYYHFDNAEFLDFLRDNRFSISNTTKNTESIWTVTIVPNLLNLDYSTTDDLPQRVKIRYMDPPVLFEMFRHNGYQVNLINHKGFIGQKDCNVISAPQFPDRITSLVFDNSVYAVIPYLRDDLRGIMDLQDNESHRDHLLEIFGSMETCTDYVGDNPTLTVSYVQCPHYPFVFDAQGNPSGGNENVRDQHYYLDQLKYLNTILEKTISNILARDPEAILVIQSDHGTRYPAQMLLNYGGPDYDPRLETPYMQNALNCVYWAGQPLDIEGQTGINTWRLLLNEAFGTDFPFLPAPEGYTCYGRSWRDKPFLPDQGPVPPTPYGPKPAAAPVMP